MEIPTLSQFLTQMQTPIGLGVAISVLMEMFQYAFAESAILKRWSLLISLILAAVIPLVALAIQTALGQSVITPDTVYLAVAAAFVTAQTLFGIKHGVKKIASQSP